MSFACHEITTARTSLRLRYYVVSFSHALLARHCQDISASFYFPPSSEMLNRTYVPGPFPSTPSVCSLLRRMQETLVVHRKLQQPCRSSFRSISHSK